MSKSYKKRVASFIKDMIMDPVHENDYYDAYKSLEHSKNRYLAHHHFRFAPSSMERHQEALDKNAFLDTSPTKLHTGKFIEQLMDLRPRIKDKEIAGPQFRHQPMTRIEQVYDALTGRTSAVLGPRDILSPDRKYRARQQRGGSTLGMTSNNTPDFRSEVSSIISSPKHRAHSPKVLPDIVNNVHPTAIVSSLHKKTHFKAATSVFLNHRGSLKHHEAEGHRVDETGRHVEKILNDISVKQNLQVMLDKTSRHVSRLRSNHKTTRADYYRSNPIKSAMDKLNRSFDINETISHGKSIITNDTANYSNASPFTIAVKQAEMYCQVESNPLKHIIKEEGKNLSPSQVAKEMLLQTKVIRRKDFTVQPLKAGAGMGKDPNSPSSPRGASFGDSASLKRNLMGGTRSALSKVIPDFQRE
ncbi:hypothetical protein FGO68_gene16544 [Halteria grandinella]|uniref:Uncharacterized protein n=1 Tax=Halteria grandinella TaxID=5974 RepID=A0A8J8T726_HALGN|nr:hypothetical protein FGO68_gene16544 [Halteria grandinella]